MTPPLALSLLLALGAGGLAQHDDWSLTWWIGFALLLIAFLFATTAMRIDRHKRMFNLNGGEVLELDGRLWKVTNVEHVFATATTGTGTKHERIYHIRLVQK